MITLPDREEFNFKECVIQDDPCWLITPKDMSVKWFDDNARFRSCIVRQSDNFVVSQGFKKFVNFGERPEFEPWDNSWKIHARHKLDGSLLIVSKYKGKLILRTRGTVDARQLGNGHEIEFLLQKYSTFFNSLEWDTCDTIDRTFLFEWTTPNNIIVLREHDEPTLTMLGWIINSTGEYFIGGHVNSYVTIDQYGFEVPKEYEYDSIEDCIMDVSAWKGKEGVVLSSPDGQTLKKIKGEHYCELHKLATGMRTIENVVDVFITSPRFTKYSDFYTYIETTLDFELAEKLKDDVLKICIAYTKVLVKIDGVRRVVDNVSGDSFSRKDRALEYQRHWIDWRKPLAFSLTDKKPIEDKMWKMAIMATLA